MDVEDWEILRLAPGPGLRPGWEHDSYEWPRKVTRLRWWLADRKAAKSRPRIPRALATVRNTMSGDPE